MKNNLKLLVVATISLSIGFSLNNFAMSNVPQSFKVAVVDIQKIVSNSSEIKNLKEEQKKKLQELTTYIQNAKKEIANEKDPTKKKALEAKHTKELTAKKTAIEKDYIKKIKNADKNIANSIKNQAKAGNYNLVLTKGVVLFGGDDITDTISAEIK